MSVILLIIFGFVSLYIYYYEIGSIVSAKSIYINEMEISDNGIFITGSTMNSALAFKSYESYSKENRIYIKMRYVLSGSILNKRTGNFTIEIKEDMKNIHEILFEGEEGTDIKSVWKKVSKE
ncbi:hypothetical protein DWB64_15955 [Fusibacter sp. A1]|nr:hypothetical protein DWB64_15955 [Fusibacter sp. A1]